MGENSPRVHETLGLIFNTSKGKKDSVKTRREAVRVRVLPTKHKDLSSA